jgi:hypothetical protein
MSYRCLRNKQPSTHAWLTRDYAPPSPETKVGKETELLQPKELFFLQTKTSPKQLNIGLGGEGGIAIHEPRMHGGLFISQTPVPGCLAFLSCYCYTLGLNKHTYSAAGSLHAWVQKVHTHCNEPPNNNPEQPFSRQHADQARLSGSLQQVLRH